MFNQMVNIELAPTIVFMLITTYTPGPNNILAGSMGGFFGYRKTLPFLLGIGTGFLSISVLSFVLSSMLSAILPSAIPILRIVGALYILWLAVSVYKSSRNLNQESKAEPLGYLQGFSLQFVNPKAYIFNLTLYSTFLSPLLKDPLTYAYVPLIATCVSYSAISTWAFSGQMIHRQLNTPKKSQMFGLILAIALVYSAIDILGIETWAIFG